MKNVLLDPAVPETKINEGQVYGSTLLIMQWRIQRLLYPIMQKCMLAKHNS